MNPPQPEPLAWPRDSRLPRAIQLSLELFIGGEMNYSHDISCGPSAYGWRPLVLPDEAPWNLNNDDNHVHPPWIVSLRPLDIGHRESVVGRARAHFVMKETGLLVRGCNKEEGKRRGCNLVVRRDDFSEGCPGVGSLRSGMKWRYGFRCVLKFIIIIIIFGYFRWRKKIAVPSYVKENCTVVKREEWMYLLIKYYYGKLLNNFELYKIR